MQRLRWVLVALVVLSARMGAANPFYTQTIFVKPLEGCKVEVQVNLLKGLTGSFGIVRGRTHFAFENTLCTQEVHELSASKSSVPDGEEREWGHTYETFKFVDEVCADGKWYYQLQEKSDGSGTTRGAAERYDPLAPSHTVEVTGCKRKECPARLEAPARILEGAPQAPPCKVELQMGYRTVGDESLVDDPLGAVLKGGDRLELKKQGARTRVKALAPGKAWVALTHPSAPGGCAEFTFTPNAYQRPSLRSKKQWAYREFTPGPIAEDTVVRLTKGARWPLPIPGTALLVQLDDLVRMGVDEQCGPVLFAQGGGGGPDYTGVKVTDAHGADHLYFISLEPDDPSLECRVVSSVTLMMGTNERIDLPPVRVAGEDLVQRLPESLVRGTHPGTLWLAKTPEDETCTRVTVVPMPATQKERIAWVTERLGEAPFKGDPLVIELKVGKTQRLPLSVHSLRGMNDGVADLDSRTSTLQALSPGFTGFILNSRQEEPRFVYVEVSEATPEAPRPAHPE